MIDTVIVSGGMIQKDFALDFIRKIEEERKGKKLLLLAADRGLDFFLETGLVPDIVDGDFDSLSGAGKAYLESLDHTEIVRLNPEKDDTDTQSGNKKRGKEYSYSWRNWWKTGSFYWKHGTFGIWQTKGCQCDPGRCSELHLSCGKWPYYSKRQSIRKICFLFRSR